jgi:hypothetical protein
MENGNDEICIEQQVPDSYRDEHSTSIIENPKSNNKCFPDGSGLAVPQHDTSVSSIE